MKILLKSNVWDEALKRINRLFDEFDEVTVGFSGGKDSTICYELTKMVARERGRLPLNVLFIDQEAEWTQTIDMVKKVMYDKDVKPYWYQMPIHLDNATSIETATLHCWEDGKESEWLREKDPISIKENNYGVDIFTGIFGAIFRKDFEGKKHCCIGGVRAEESPRRLMGLTQMATYKDITWGTKDASPTNHFTFYPIYDWSYTDVWKAINDNSWEYNEIYDYQFRYGVSIPNMRVSNLHHETAVRSLFYLQEIDAELYSKLTQRMAGADMAGKMGASDYYIRKLPYMFKSWLEYAEFLKDNLVKDDDWNLKISKFIDKHIKVFGEFAKGIEDMAKIVCQTIITNDRAGTKFKNFESSKTSFFKKDKAMFEEKMLAKKI